MGENIFQNSYIDLIILKFLDERDMYGYEIMECLNMRSEGMLVLKTGTLYPILAGMAQQGVVETYESSAESGRIRKYYRLTKKGKKMLEDKTTTWCAWSEVVNRILGAET